MSKCKITILKRMLYKDLAEMYSSEHLPDKPLTACSAFHDGQEFILENLPSMPQGFCYWAWTDIQRDVAAIMYGADYPWMSRKGVLIVCCSDGIRPVIFKLERLNE